MLIAMIFEFVIFLLLVEWEENEVCSPGNADPGPECQRLLRRWIGRAGHALQAKPLPAAA